MSFIDLAEVASLAGDRKAEESYRRRALSISRQVYDESHPYLAMAIGDLGKVLCRDGNENEGAALLAEAITLHRKAGAKEGDLASWRDTRARCIEGDKTH